jgi:hypothetical protein
MKQVQEFPELGISIIKQSLNVVLISSRKPLSQNMGVKLFNHPLAGTYLMVGQRYFSSLHLMGHSGECYTYRTLEHDWQKLPRCVQEAFYSLIPSENTPKYFSRWI